MSLRTDLRIMRFPKMFREKNVHTKSLF